MLIFPAIDLKDGAVVRLYKGDFATSTRWPTTPWPPPSLPGRRGPAHPHGGPGRGQGRTEEKRGHRPCCCRYGPPGGAGGRHPLHGGPGGGVRLGVWRAVIGSAAVSDPDFVREAIARYGPEKVAVGIDAKDGHVRTAGWVRDEGLDYLQFAKFMESIGVKYIIFTDIDTDGTLSGPALGRLEALQKAVGCAITASGGVSSNGDLRQLRDMGLYAAIVGKAWYAGAVDLALAVEEGGEQA